MATGGWALSGFDNDPAVSGAAGATGAAGAAGVVPDAGTTSLSTTHYTATLASRPEPLTSGYAFLVKFNATNPASADIALSSGTAQPLYSNGAALPAGAIVAGCPYLCRSNGTQVEVLGIVPSTLGATTFSGYAQAQQFYVTASLVANGSGNAGSIAYCGGAGSGGEGAYFRPWGIAGTYPGASHSVANLATRAASTAIALCPVATGDSCEVKIRETTIAGCWVFVDEAGTVTLYSPTGGTVNAKVVNSSGPASDGYGVYVSAGVLYFKGGSGFAGKMASQSIIWKA